MRYDPSLTRTRFASPRKPAPVAPGWALALIGLAVVMLTCGGVVL